MVQAVTKTCLPTPRWAASSSMPSSVITVLSTSKHTASDPLRADLARFSVVVRCEAEVLGD